MMGGRLPDRGDATGEGGGGGADDAGKVAIGQAAPFVSRTDPTVSSTFPFPPLVDVLKVASTTASKVMRSGNSTGSPDFLTAAETSGADSTNGNGAAPEPVSPASTAADPPSLAALLSRQWRRAILPHTKS